MFALVYSNQNDSIKQFNGKRYYSPNGILKNYNIIINRKNFNDQLIGSNIKRYEEIRTLKACENYTTFVRL